MLQVMDVRRHSSAQEPARATQEQMKKYGSGDIRPYYRLNFGAPNRQTAEGYETGNQ